MQAYKIKVANSQESKEAQELFFAMGHKWKDGDIDICVRADIDILFLNQDGIFYRSRFDEMPKQYYNYKEITLPQLRDLAVLHRNDVSDATHDAVDGNKYYVGCEVYYWNSCNTWMVSDYFALGDVSSRLKPITQEQPQMTQQDAYAQLVCDKEVEFLNSKTDSWLSLIKYTPEFVFKYASNYRLAPQRKTLNGNFTKEELLKFAGEMT